MWRRYYIHEKYFIGNKVETYPPVYQQQVYHTNYGVGTFS